FRIICMDQSLGSGAITQGVVTIEPGKQTRPHTHRVEESMTLLEGRLRVLIGTEVTEVDAPATFLAPANTVHGLRNVGTGDSVYRLSERERRDVLRRGDRILGRWSAGGWPPASSPAGKKNPARPPRRGTGPDLKKACLDLLDVRGLETLWTPGHPQPDPITPRHA